MNQNHRTAIVIGSLLVGAAAGAAVWVVVHMLSGLAEAWDVWFYMPVLFIAGLVFGLLPMRTLIAPGYFGCVVGQLVWMLATSPPGPWPWWFSGLWMFLYTLPFVLGAWLAQRARVRLTGAR